MAGILRSVPCASGVVTCCTLSDDRRIHLLSAILGMDGDPLIDLVWTALHTSHAHFAVRCGDACRYPADVAPFAAVADTTPRALAALEELLVPGEQVYLVGKQPPPTAGLFIGPPLAVFQMLRPPEAAIKIPAAEIPLQRLGHEDAGAMVALTDLAFPGFYRPRTHEMGAYYGIRINGELIAMAGERLALPGLREVSAVCTHPAHTGKGYAGKLMAHVIRQHETSAITSFLHVHPSNSRAIALYEWLGFRITKAVALWPASRPDNRAAD